MPLENLIGVAIIALGMVLTPGPKLQSSHVPEIDVREAADARLGKARTSNAAAPAAIRR